jgi:thiol-disulfide isomerase/thioredoxin
MKKELITKKNIANVLFIGLLLTIFFVPSAKALVMQGLMEIGLFKPSLNEQKSILNIDLSTIKFKDAKNKVVSLADFEGKVVFLNFWATWCPPCLAEMPGIHKLYQQFANDGDVVFLMVDADNNFKKSQSYLDRKNYTFPLFVPASDVPDVIFKGSLPTTIVFDKKGRIAYNGVGAANYANPKFVAFIQTLKTQKD